MTMKRSLSFMLLTGFVLLISCRTDQEILNEHPVETLSHPLEEPDYEFSVLYSDSSHGSFFSGVFKEGEIAASEIFWNWTESDLLAVESPVFPLVFTDRLQVVDKSYLLFSIRWTSETEITRRVIPLPENASSIDLEALKRVVESVSAAQKPLIILDSGHGGQDPGAVGHNRVLEKDYNKRLTGLLANELETRGYEVLLCYDIERDYFLSNQARAAIAARYSNALFISLHHNSSPDKDVRGFSTFFSSFNHFDEISDPYIMVDGEPKPYSRQISNGRQWIDLYYFDEDQEKSHRLPRNDGQADIFIRDHHLSPRAVESLELALYLHEGLNSVEALSPYYYNHRLIDHRDYRVLVDNPHPAVLIETGFITNPEEAQLLSHDEVLQDIVDELSSGIDLYCSSRGIEETLSLK